ncbi:hypothetical protein Cgig2_023509 [Carnegiea gigantea]|uniref:Avr9/Cf-9 rapidly elicited protein 146 n=1 Tax=Carnegiea gigantea TaxID=171969 RepID=A0A9Q1Q8E9_9CARY|nr:hypothetical protein Cgig2_023509 [Carnegiea gigantea]
MEAGIGGSQSKKLAKKMWRILRAMLRMMKKSGASKANLIIMSLKKAMNGLLLHHSSLICLPNHPSNHFFSPSKLDYQFSCNNSPALGPYLIHMAHHHRPKPKPKSRPGCNHLEDPTTVAAAVHQVLEMINTSEGTTGSSPLGMDYFLPGFGNGKSPTDGKGDVEELEEDVKVSKAADEFIKKFYTNLRMQKSFESPYHMWAR